MTKVHAIVRRFRCWFCDFIEQVEGSPVPKIDPIFFIFGSAADFCSNCGEPREWADKEGPDGEEVCLDELQSLFGFS